MTLPNSLETKVFQDELDFKTFENILETLDHITPKKVSRENFNSLKGNFLVETGEEKKYDLFLPDDLKIYELPAIISRVNKITFGEILPNYASKEELKVKITITINTLFQVLNEKRLTDEEKKEVQRAIKKYVKLFEDLYGTEESQKLSNEDYRNEIIEKSKKSQSFERFKEYQTKLERVKTKEKLDELLSEIEENMSSEISEHFDESFFERGVNMLRIGMMTITQAEQEAREKWLIENGYKLDKIKDGIKIYIKESDLNPTREIIALKEPTSSLDKKEKLLRDKIGIDKIKEELDEARKSGNQEKINQAEIKATNAIIKVIYEYPYQLTQNNFGYQPNKIAEFKEIYCIGFSLLGHTFLSELGIKHKGLNIPGHSALEVDIGGKNYYFDATSKSKITEFKYGDKFGEYIEVDIDGRKTKILPGETEKVLLGQIYNNRGALLVREEKYSLALKLINKSIILNPKLIEAYISKGSILFKLGKYKESLDELHKALKIDKNDTNAYERLMMLLLNHFKETKKYNDYLDLLDIAISIKPKNQYFYFDKGEILMEMGKFKEANECFDKVIDLKPEYKKSYINKSKCLFELGEYNKAMKIYDYLIKIEPSISEYYNGKSLCLLKINKTKISELYKYTGDLINGIGSLVEGNNELYGKEKREIKKFVRKKDFEGLRLYLLELEKEEN